ncbi:MAG: dephospho-CoA kinase, partial [Pirellulales bacterium]
DVLDADAAGHEVLKLDEVKRAVRDRWGDAVFAPDGEINRAAVAAIVFAQTPEAAGELAFLEQLTHPRISERLRDQIAEIGRRGPSENRQARVAVLDAPVMLKAGWDTLCDLIVYVDAPRDVRRSRARGRGWSDAEFSAREAAQESLEAKRKRADEIIDNSGPLMATQAQVARIWQKLPTISTTAANPSRVPVSP